MFFTFIISYDTLKTITNARRTAMYKITKRMGILLSLCLFLCGCGKKEQTPVEITLLHGWGGTLQTHRVMQEIYQEFQDENPDIVFTCIASSDSSIAVDNANELLAVGKTPDIVSTNGLSYYVSNAIELNEALDLMPYIEKDPDFAKMIHSQVLEIWITEDGHIYTLPDALEVMGYWYNAELLRKAGYGENGKAMPDTWDAFYTMCDDVEKILTDEEAVVRLEEAQVSENFFYARLRGDRELEDLGHPTLAQCVNSPAFEHSVDAIEKLYFYSVNADNLETARENFVNGKTALYFNGIWESQVLSESSGEFEFACYPTDSGKSLVYVSPSSGYLIAKHEDERKNEACIRFLKYILSAEIQEKLAVESDQAPENPMLDSERLYEENPLLGKALEKANAADIQIISLSTEWGSQAANILNTFLNGNSID